MKDRPRDPQDVYRPSSRLAGAVASSVMVLAALLVVAAYNWSAWHVWLLAWGLALVLAGVLFSVVSKRLTLRFDRSTSKGERSRPFLLINEICLFVVGVGVAVLASGTGWVAVDAGFTALFVLGSSISTIAGIQVMRRTR